MELFQSALLGIIEGITEFLPISSTGHLILASNALGIPHTEFLKSFEIIIQLGAILAVIALYWRDFLKIEILKKLFVAFLPTAVIGFALYPFIKGYLLGNEVVVLWALLLGGAALIVFEIFHKENAHTTGTITTMNYQQAALIGVAQALAVIPGVSRSAATIVGGLLLGMKRIAIVEFSFLLAVPTMMAATGLDLVKSYSSFSMDQFGVLAVGFITSFVVATLAIKFLLAFVRTHTFIAFGFYRIILAIVFFLFIL
ncbi:MAG: undecaprenyl-diphosphatase UppP [Candidatus Pacebacteria bacterium]|nr:undecaprenyl-diphosphatase UppP [Candidatus Paceibacterota bacterium]